MSSSHQPQLSDGETVDDHSLKVPLVQQKGNSSASVRQFGGASSSDTKLMSAKYCIFESINLNLLFLWLCFNLMFCSSSGALVFCKLLRENGRFKVNDASFGKKLPRTWDRAQYLTLMHSTLTIAHTHAHQQVTSA
jgi:hypothetical protein